MGGERVTLSKLQFQNEYSKTQEDDAEGKEHCQHQTEKESNEKQDGQKDFA